MADENPPNQGNADNDNNNQRRGNNGRNNRERGVRGPTSALSSFLREKGISVPTNPYARIQQQNASNETLSEIDSAKDVDEIQESTLDGQNGASNLHDVVPEFPAKKEEPMPVPKRKRRIPDDEDFLKLIKLCGTCKRRFISHSEQAFCHACLSVGAKSSKAVKKQRKKQQSVVLEVTGRLDSTILPLRDMCIRVISDHIDEIDSLGYMDTLTKIKLSRIVSKRRKLTTHNLGLFIEEDGDELRLFDYLDEKALAEIPLGCPNLSVLELGLAGQITDHVLNLIGTCCKNLRVLRIHGSFLCSANGWIKLFQELENLQEIRLEYAVKLSDLAIKTLVQSCSSLEVVELIECPNVTNEGVLEFSKLKGISTLTVDSLGSIESPHLQKVVESHAKTLKSLSVNKYTVLNRNPQLSVELLDSITMCENLERLSLKFCPGLTAESENLVSLFTKLSSLKNVNLTGNTSVTDDVVNSLLNIHGESLEVLSLNGINELTERSLLLVSTKLPKIKELDVSWIRSFTDILLVELLRNSADIETIKIFGCNLLSGEVLDKEWHNKHGNRIIIVGNEFD